MIHTAIHNIRMVLAIALLGFIVLATGESVRSPDVGLGEETQTAPRITGGYPANIKDYPFMVSIYHKKRFICAGSIFYENSILTTADCVNFDKRQKQGRFYIKAGDLRLRAKDPYEQKHFISKIVVHPKYYVRKFGNNLAMLFLETNITTNDYARYIWIPGVDKVDPILDLNNCEVAGWGMNRSGFYSWQLQVIEAPLLSDHECWTYLNLYGGKYIKKKSNLCTYTGDPFGKGGACHGDYGAPLICYTKQNKPQLIGVLEFTNCYGSHFFTGTAEFLPWILNEAGLT